MPRARRKCGAKGCYEYVPCPDHKPVDLRPGPRQRGYDAEHDAERAEWAPTVASGTVECRRASNGTCRDPDGHVIRAGAPWDLGHPDAECPAPRAPEHRSCNRATRDRASRRTV